MPVLQKFMCCWQLRTGAVLIGWIGLVIQVIGLIADSAILANAEEEYAEKVKVPLTIGLTCTIISTIANGMLIWGTNSKNRFFLLPWLISTMVMIIGLDVMLIIIGVTEGSNGANSVRIAVLFIFGFLITGIVLYLWICVLSFFQELREGGDAITRQPKRPRTTPNIYF